MTVNELIYKLQSLPENVKDKPVFYFDSHCREQVKFVIVGSGLTFLSHKILWDKKTA